MVDALQKQYASFKISEKTSENIELLKQQNTYTISTGHQLNLFTGPLYFLYKIISTINLCEELAEKFSEDLQEITQKISRIKIYIVIFL